MQVKIGEGAVSGIVAESELFHLTSSLDRGANNLEIETRPLLQHQAAQ